MSLTKLHIESIGQGPDLVMLHGWGVNSAVFTPLQGALTKYRVHFVDLPGFGDSQAVEGDIHDWLNAILEVVPQQAIWTGWSLGGLVATLAAIHHPQRVSALCTIASSPCFMATEEWPGIPENVLSQFAQQLTHDLDKTIERFLAIQAMGSATAKGDIKQLRELVLAKPKAQQSALAQGLTMLERVDLRSQLPQISQPWLRIWGRLDGLVPRRVIKTMPQLSRSQDLLLNKASHAPFISHQQEFVEGFNQWLDKLV
ncbi:pimeloyl-ACP methyl ester esterase BioH [Shewanella schlegeliana]|uniref:Pimeloyl-[acyl-carrier protein] methyl ester esterase n=1 Tax=Shewanella schlegeliana TaxID=190308 RepID=A0ABS1T1W2_9GAMM|nr:pimeloyl-ACP methyl ester esterase BioH [Shewanella schlegeliana]MBL4914787.1 pimeloyl-ACP methyl ester esterase BioH [Shewanella schlegeliana]MCL1111825.1 pimeloyl-ACP methyl ester esterase BioH [Shewanella schlegeliana]GIU38276.1 pimeloyl-[acyl-carrier protein] methyl ester esterase [Shewanella schlegeliana]